MYFFILSTALSVGLDRIARVNTSARTVYTFSSQTRRQQRGVVYPMLVIVPCV